jgi:YD repeat-containing protein
MRASKTVGGIVTKHLWDGANITAETNGSNAETAKYFRRLSLIARDNGSGKEFYNFNGHGDTTSLTNASGNVIISYNYDTFGNRWLR